MYILVQKKKPQLQYLDEVDPEILATFEKLGISLNEQKQLAPKPINPDIEEANPNKVYQKIAIFLGLFAIMSASFLFLKKKNKKEK